MKLQRYPTNQELRMENAPPAVVGKPYKYDLTPQIFGFQTMDSILSVRGNLILQPVVNCWTLYDVIHNLDYIYTYSKTIK